MTDFRRIIATIVLYAGAVLIGFALVSVPSSIVHLQSTHGLTDEQYGKVFIPQLLLAIGGALLAGPVIRKISLKSMYAVALICFGASQAALASTADAQPAEAWLMIMVSTALFGFGFGFGGGPLNGLIGNMYPQRSASAITGLHLMAGIGLMLGPLYFRLFERIGSWQSGPVYLAAFAGLLLATSLVALQTNPLIFEGHRSRSPARSRFFWLMIVLAFLYALVEGAFSNWAVIFVSIEKAASRDGGAVALATFWAGLTFGRLLATLAVTRIGAMRLWMVLPILMLTAFLVLPLLQTERALILGYGLAGFACSAFFPLMVTVAAKPFPEHLSWIASMLTASLMLGVGVGSYVIGVASRSVPIAHMYLYFSTIPIVAFSMMWLYLRHEVGPE
ncbi:MAG: MFS transporter [Woeseia sp.]